MMAGALSQPAAERRRISERRRLFLVVSLYWFSLYVYIPYQTVYLTGLGAAALLVGLVTGAYGYGQILLRIPLGILADHHGNNRFFMLVGTAVPALASFVRMLFPSADGYLAANLLSGVGAAMWVCFIVDFSRRMPEATLQKSAALISAANQIGILAGFLLSLLLYRPGDMSGLLWASVIGAAAAFSLTLTLSRVESGGEAPEIEQDSVPEAEPIVSTATVLRQKSLWQYAVFGFLQIGLLLATAQSFSTQYCQRIGGDHGAVGLMNVIYMAVSVVFSFLAARRFAHRLGAKTILCASYALMAVYCLLVPRVTVVWQLLLLQTLGGVNAGLVPSFAMAEAGREITKTRHNTAMGVYQAAVGLGISLVPLFTGWLIGRSGLSGAYNALALLALLTAVYALLLKNPHERSQSPLKNAQATSDRNKN